MVLTNPCNCSYLRRGVHIKKIPQCPGWVDSKPL